MNLDRYQKLYRTAPAAKRIGARYLDLDVEHVRPLSLSHGVDFGHEAVPQDALAPEPVHWCYHEAIRRSLGDLKQGVELPHPWLMLERMDGRPPLEGGTLLIGPPPSRSNDESLYERLQAEGIKVDAMLVKARRDDSFETSCAFWRDRGVEPVSAGPADDGHYQRLLALIGRHDRVALPVFSSVGLFAAALGVRVQLVHGYSHCSYSPRRLDLNALLAAPLARKAIEVFADGDVDEQRTFARGMFGATYDDRPAVLRQRVQDVMSRVRAPVFVPVARGRTVASRLLAEAARITGRIDFLRTGPVKALGYRFTGTSGELICKRVNMIDALQRGAFDASNLQVRSLSSSEASARSGCGADF